MIITRTPLRISFAGGGTDFPDFYRNNTHPTYPGGAVISATIDKYLYVIVKKRFDDKIVVNYTKTEVVDHPREVQHDLVREALELTGHPRGIEITTLADVPSHGCGLGSSSSLTVGLLAALSQYRGERLSAKQLAEFACQIEVERLKKPIGKQDQYAAACGGLNWIQFDSNGAVLVYPLYLPSDVYQRLSEDLLLFYTGVSRQSTSILQEQNKKIGANFNRLLEMRKDVHECYKAIYADTYHGIGEFLTRGWEQKRLLASTVSSEELDNLVARALSHGATGAKIVGAGGGGFLLVECPKDAQFCLRHGLKELRELKFNFEPHGSKVIFDAD